MKRVWKCGLAGFLAVPAVSIAMAQGGQAQTGPAQAGSGQTGPAGVPGGVPRYEVASVRENKNPNPAWNMYFTGDGVHAMDVTLLWALSEAYGVRDLSLISGGPAWADEKRFDIEAKYDVSQYPKLTREQQQEMLQQLLADRFKLVVHKEAKEFPLYALVVTKSGPKFEGTKPEDVRHNRMGGEVCVVTKAQPRKGLLAMEGCALPDLANTLYGVALHDLARRVVDQTDLKGRYTLELHWTPIDTANPGATAPSADGASGPSIFDAVKEQLGLELKPTKGPIDTMVIDHAELPTEN